MKKIKLIKLRNKKRKKNIKISKLYLVLICLTIYLIIIILLIRFFKKAKKNNIVANELDNYNTIIYKGELIQRKQLITEYLSRITDDNRIVGNEKRRLLNLYYLPEYSNDPIFQENIKKNSLI
jgi:amino acid permease